MERTEYVSMKCGNSLGPLLHQMAQEKITQEYDPRKAFDIWDACGISPIHWNELLDMKMIAIIKEDGDGEITSRDSLSEEELSYYPEPIDWESWIIKKCQKFQENDDDFIKSLTNCYNKFEQRIIGDDIALTMNNILKHYEKEDYSWIKDRSDECFDMSYYNEECFCALLSRLYDNLSKRKKFISCAKWLCEQFGCLKARPKVQKYTISLRTLENIHNALIRKSVKALNELLPKENKFEMASASVGTDLQQYLDALKSQDEYELKPIDITEGWDAGFILPDGTVYAMNGPESSFIHVAIAEYYFEENGLVYDPEYFGKDFQLMAQGWIKFNKQKILYDGYMALDLGKCYSAGLTQRQKDVLCKYIDSTWNKMIYLGIHGKAVTKNELLSMTDEDLEKVFS